MRKKIFINSDNIFSVKKNLIKKLFFELEKTLGFHFNKIEVSFVSDFTITEINTKHLNHNWPTDIITFDYSEANFLECELIISYETAILNARKFHVELNSEIIRLLVHGILHIIGYDDKTTSKKIIMKKKENELVNVLSKKYQVLGK